MKPLGFLLLFAIPASAQAPAAPSFEHGHRIASNYAMLAASPDDPFAEGAGVASSNGATLASVAGAEGKYRILVRNVNGQLLVTPAGGGPGGVVFNPDGSVSDGGLSQKPSATFETWAEQRSSDYMESAQAGFTGVERSEGKAVLHRFLRDEVRNIYVSYNVTVETRPDGTYRVSFGPPTDPAPEKLRGNAAWMLLSPAQYPLPQIVKDDDSIRLELYSNGVSRRVVDYVHAGRQDRIVDRKDTPHDSYADDAEFAITRPRFRMNGEIIAPVTLPETLRAPVLWVYVPGQGRYTLSFHARPELGFQSAGEVVGSSLMFNVAGNIVRIDAADRIAAGSGDYTVHVRPDPNWIPADPNDRDRVMLGTSPGL